MKAMLVERFGRPEDLVLRDLPDPEPGPGEVLVETHAIGLNYPDLLVIGGTYQILPPLPFAPGKELAGVVRAVGAGVAGFRPGQRVAAQLESGAFAELVRVPAALCYPVPDGLATAKAAAMGLVYQTSWYALTDRARLKPGEWVLVTGAAGGVGIAAVELAKAMGAKVVAGLGTMAKADFVRRHGADAVVDLATPDLKDGLRKAIHAATDGHGVDVVIDPVGGAVFEASLRALAWDGRLVVVGFTSGAIPSVKANYLLIKHITVTGIHWSDYPERDPAGVARAQAEMFAMAADGRLDPPVMASVPLERAAEGLALIAGRKVEGKVVLVTEAGRRAGVE
ncbi:NADPH:quinone oxidoreductase family protein [Stella sp.]|uniref:NADPH:quinone oxidoreductase family protein n=1 Tax=Stella sp. TaxID=2912054 RepID=UPI0035B18FF3